MRKWILEANVKAQLQKKTCEKSRGVVQSFTIAVAGEPEGWDRTGSYFRDFGF